MVTLGKTVCGFAPDSAVDEFAQIGEMQFLSWRW
jgi:hypothetical protein